MVSFSKYNIPHCEPYYGIRRCDYKTLDISVFLICHAVTCFECHAPWLVQAFRIQLYVSTMLEAVVNSQHVFSYIYECVFVKEMLLNDSAFLAEKPEGTLYYFIFLSRLNADVRVPNPIT